MIRRAFIAFLYTGRSGETVQSWGTCDLPWPPRHSDLQRKLDDLVAMKPAQPESGVLTSLSWISEPRDEE